MPSDNCDDLVPLAQAMAGTDGGEKLRAQVVLAKDVAQNPSEWGPESPPQVIGYVRKMIDGVPIDRRDVDDACEAFAARLHELTRKEADNAAKLRVLLGAIATLSELADDGFDEAARMVEPLEQWTRQHYRFSHPIPSDRAEIRKLAGRVTRRYDVIPRSVRRAFMEKGFDFMEIQEESREPT